MANLFESVRQDVPIKQVAMRYGLDLDRNDMAYCCFHEDSNRPSMKLYENNNTFHCFGCKKTGSVIDLTMQLLDIPTAKEAALRLADDFNIIYDKPEYNQKPKYEKKQYYYRRKKTEEKTKEIKEVKSEKEIVEQTQITRLNNVAAKCRPLLDYVNIDIKVEKSEKTGKPYLEVTDRETKELLSNEKCTSAKSAVHACGNRFAEAFLNAENCCQYKVKGFESYEYARQTCIALGYEEKAKLIGQLIEFKGIKTYDVKYNIPLMRNRQFGLECGVDKNGKLYLKDTAHKKIGHLEDTPENRIKLVKSYNVQLNKAKKELDIKLGRDKSNKEDNKEENQIQRTSHSIER